MNRRSPAEAGWGHGGQAHHRLKPVAKRICRLKPGRKSFSTSSKTHTPGQKKNESEHPVGRSSRSVGFSPCVARQEDYFFLQHLAGVLTTFASTTGAGLCEQALRVATAKTVARNRCFIGRKVFPLFAKESRSDSRRMRLIGYFFGFTQCSALPQTHLSEEKEDQELRKSGDFFSKSRLHLKICG